MIKRFLAAAAIPLATATTLAVAPTNTVEAAVQHKRFTTSQLIRLGVHPDIARGFKALGVPVIDGRTLRQVCNSEPGITIRAIYNFKLNAVVACAHNMKNKRQFVTSVTHEAVHMVQDCRAGLANNTLDAGTRQYTVKLWQHLPLHLRENITDVYDIADWDYEIEAFYFQSRPNAVAEGIRTFCF